MDVVVVEQELKGEDDNTFSPTTLLHTLVDSLYLLQVTCRALEAGKPVLQKTHAPTPRGEGSGARIFWADGPYAFLTLHGVEEGP